MEDIRLRALTIYLQHLLFSALHTRSEVKQLQEDLLQSGKRINSIPRMKQVLCVRHAVEACLFGRSEQRLVRCAAATFATADWVRPDICDPALLIMPGKQTDAVDLYYLA
jgi:hypothetical protein